MKGRGVFLSMILLFLFLVSSAFAIEWPRYWKIKFTNWEWFNPYVSPGYDSGPDGNEDNWGIARVTTIYDLPDENIVWSAGPGDNKSLRIFFYGLDLLFWDNETGKYAMGVANSTQDGKPLSGAYLEIYEWDEDWDGSIVNATKRNGDSFSGITDGGKLLAKFEFTYGVTDNQSIVATGTTGGQDIPIGNPPTGTGKAYLKIVDGLYKDAWDINLEGLKKVMDIVDKDFNPDWVDPEADIYIKFSFEPRNKGGFHLGSEDPGYGATVPEPATVVLVGTGLLIIGTIVRKKS